MLIENIQQLKINDSAKTLSIEDFKVRKINLTRYNTVITYYNISQRVNGIVFLIWLIRLFSPNVASNFWLPLAFSSFSFYAQTSDYIHGNLGSTGIVVGFADGIFYSTYLISKIKVSNAEEFFWHLA